MTPLFLLTLLGSPVFQDREDAQKALTALATYRDPVVLIGLTSSDPEVVYRCSIINDRARQKILARMEPFPDIRGLAWNGEGKSQSYPKQLWAYLTQNELDGSRASREYAWDLLDLGLPESSVRSVMKYIHDQSQESDSYYRMYYGCPRPDNIP